jgi:nucleoside-diphosphate-sugar epimerase
MTRVRETGGRGLVGNRVMLRFLAAGREVRTIVESPTRAAEVRATLDTRDVQPGAHASFIATDRDHQAGRLDAAAGCEFVDDRIRY